jgi:hypothetical protein
MKHSPQLSDQCASGESYALGFFQYKFDVQEHMDIGLAVLRCQWVKKAVRKILWEHCATTSLELSYVGNDH